MNTDIWNKCREYDAMPFFGYIVKPSFSNNVLTPFSNYVLTLEFIKVENDDRYDYPSMDVLNSLCFDIENKINIKCSKITENTLEFVFTDYSLATVLALYLRTIN